MIAKVYIGNFNPACMSRHYWWFHAFSLAGYLKNGRRIIYAENQCIRTPFSVR